jgi:hypothetical protein
MGFRNFAFALFIHTLGVLLGQVSASAHPGEISSPAREIILMTSFDPAQTPLPQQLPDWIRNRMHEVIRSVPESLEGIFRGHFDSGQYSLRVIHRATQLNIWEAIHSPRTLGLIWISHAGAATPSSGGLQAGNPVIDADHFDVANVFQDFHPNLRFLGLVACDSGYVLTQQFLRHSVRRRSPNLYIYGFRHPVDATEGLRTVQSWSNQVLELITHTHLRPPLTTEVRPSLELRLTRRFDYLPQGSSRILPAVRIENLAGTVLGVFPPSQNRSSQTLILRIRGNLRGFTDSSQLNLVMNAGDNPRMSSEQMSLGRFEVTAPSVPSLRWSAYSNAEGNPIGFTQNLYEFQGELPLLSVLQQE